MTIIFIKEFIFMQLLYIHGETMPTCWQLRKKNSLFGKLIGWLRWKNLALRPITLRNEPNQFVLQSILHKNWLILMEKSMDAQKSVLCHLTLIIVATTYTNWVMSKKVQLIIKREQLLEIFIKKLKSKNLTAPVTACCPHVVAAVSKNGLKAAYHVLRQNLTLSKEFC